MKQRLLGAALVASSVLMCKMGGDATAVVFIAPLGLWTLFTKETILR